MTRRSASAKEHLHHPRGKHGREDGRRRSCGVPSGRTTNVPLDVRQSTATRRRGCDGRPSPRTPAFPRVQPTRSTATGRPTETERPTPPRPRTTERLRTTGATATERYLRKLEDFRTFGPSRAPGRPNPTGRPTPVCAAAGLWPCIPLPLTPSWLRL